MKRRTAGSSATCVKCRRRRAGRSYTFRIGVTTGITTRAGIGSVETTTHVRILGLRSGFVCERCARRHVVLRFCLPLLVCMAYDGILLDGLPFGGAQLPGTALRIMGVIALCLAATMARGLRDTVSFPLVRGARTGCLAVLELLFGWACWALGLFGQLLLLMLTDDLQGGRSSLTEGVSRPALPLWITGVIVGCQVCLLLSVRFAWPLLVETLAWRRRRPRLQEEVGVRRLVGVNSVRYALLDGALHRWPRRCGPPPPGREGSLTEGSRKG